MRSINDLPNLFLKILTLTGVSATLRESLQRIYLSIWSLLVDRQKGISNPSLRIGVTITRCRFIAAKCHVPSPTLQETPASDDLHPALPPPIPDSRSEYSKVPLGRQAVFGKHRHSFPIHGEHLKLPRILKSAKVVLRVSLKVAQRIACQRKPPTQQTDTPPPEPSIYASASAPPPPTSAATMPHAHPPSAA